MGFVTEEDAIDPEQYILVKKSEYENLQVQSTELKALLSADTDCTCRSRRKPRKTTRLTNQKTSCILINMKSRQPSQEPMGSYTQHNTAKTSEAFAG
jgi:hypothetical protein